MLLQNIALPEWGFGITNIIARPTPGVNDLAPGESRTVRFALTPPAGLRRPWARRLLVRAFVTDFEKELQHHRLMTTPYGELRYGGRSVGAQ